HLLWLAAAQPQTGLTSLFDRLYVRCKMGCWEKLPDPSYNCDFNYFLNGGIGRRSWRERRFLWYMTE
ncbi:MAG: hypothetical protein PVJ54_12000, partial [Desulfobacterales bacterium]